jgi:hypothetical protein
MILVLSYDGFEQGTDPVIDWLLYYQADFVKVTVRDFYSHKLDYKIDYINDKVVINGEDYFNKINSVWCRRFIENVSFEESTHWPYSQATYELNREQASYFDSLYHLLKDKKWLLNPRLGNINKINVQKEASLAGLKTPQTIVCNSRKELLNFHKEMGKVITKPIEFSGFFKAGSQTWATYTTEMTYEMINALPENFVFSFFQQKIEAHYEVRVFYLDGDFYATAAIFDTESRMADIKNSYQEDFLHWNNYELPEDIKTKLDKLMKTVGLNTGSIDLLKSKDDNEYYFLEVNPGGQYSAPSDRSNYDLEKKIAQWLIKNDSHERN